jgi:hypothetical protein
LRHSFTVSPPRTIVAALGTLIAEVQRPIQLTTQSIYAIAATRNRMNGSRDEDGVLELKLATGTEDGGWN